MDPRWDIEVTKTIGVLCVVYRRNMIDKEIVAYRSVLKKMNLTYEQVQKAADIYMGNPEYDKFPVPAQLKACLGLTNKQLAIEVASRIKYALTHYNGNYDEHFQKAREYMGSLAWETVKQMGGWHSFITATVHDDNLYPRCRDLAAQILDKQQLGIPLDQKPELSQMQNQSAIQIGDLLKSIPKE